MKVSKIIHVEALKLLNRQNSVLLIIFLIINSIMIAGLLTISFTVNTGDASAASAIEKPLSSLYSFYIDKISFFQSVFVAILIIINASNEYRYGIVNKALIDGYTRSEFLQSKVLVTIITAILLAFLSTSEFIIVADIVRDSSFIDALNVVGFWSVLRLLVYLLSFGIIGLFLSHIFRNGNLAMVAFFGWVFIEKLLVIIDNNSWTIGLSDYLPVSIFAKVTDLSILPAFTIAQVVGYLFVILTSYFYLFSKSDI